MHPCVFLCSAYMCEVTSNQASIQYIYIYIYYIIYTHMYIYIGDTYSHVPYHRSSLHHVDVEEEEGDDDEEEGWW